ncbi:alkyl/aryl-sulfatase [Streptomyces brasiliensis]|uniref:Linear primary-alkylsulfatase n=1 Tax=Streptomyces brasiliensis TaxID=1954 RepID=A0A917L8E9_9ACTN|nr:alkyl sulfatase dimerization domain-containing protein [Streptomyces brasiliensis]GGJ49424.1 beta-lactamase-like protein [Streptomyces brasiliensis]
MNRAADTADITPDFADRTDFENADRGFVAPPESALVTGADGHVVWNFDDTAFLDGDCPGTVHPSLWRQAQLCARAGLYEVTEGVFQIRGYDLSNMSLIEGDRGIVVVDPLVSPDCAAAGLALYRAERGDRPVTAVIYTHSHIDHFGGVHGVLSARDPDGSPGGSDVPIVAPQGFMAHSVTENIYAGTAMLRRGDYYSGRGLDPGPTGLVGTGLGFTASNGTPGLLSPTVEIRHTGQEAVLDGVLFRFQMTPGTEAPAEMNFMLPERHALCVAENAGHNLHNILTLRGALVRDGRVWSRQLTEAIELFAHDADVLFASHHWPTWGRDRIRSYLSEQRDLYGYLHDQTLRLANQGHTGIEIAEMLELPPALSRAWHARGYYGSVSHNVKAVYQRYMGWYDGNPASLWEHPPVETAKRYVDCIGGIDAVLEKGRAYLDEGDLRFAAQLLKHAVFAEPDNTDAKELLADTFERLGYGAECATWRNCYLTGARELRTGIRSTPLPTAGMAGALTVGQVFDALAIRVDGPRAWNESLSLHWHFTDLGEMYRMTLHNGVLVHSRTTQPPDSTDFALRLTKPQLLRLLSGRGLDGVRYSGDPVVLKTLMALLDEPDPGFAVVTP